MTSFSSFFLFFIAFIWLCYECTNAVGTDSADGKVANIDGPSKANVDKLDDEALKQKHILQQQGNDSCRSIFAKHPVLLKSNIFYFEISVKTMESFIDFGFAVKQQTKLDEEIFDHKGNYAYESDGEIWISGEGKGINAEYSYGAGDTVGIAINLDTRQIIFTKNGLRLDFFLFDSPPTSSDALPLFPFVSLYSFNDQIEANFGPNFKFDLTNF
ncbi:hypothetical protein niasHT_029877 [Heterodera trifolii]|uniref:B30.2/SPRY domain-containing protein n=1 Tax=Heterodera trifolii TaxID=157864 RepID=A0ABD2KB39_9BILA